MGTKANPSSYDCYANLEPDEPYFVLMARDNQAAYLVRDWASTRLAQIETGQRPEEDRKQVDEAMQCAADMVKWRDVHRPRPKPIKLKMTIMRPGEKDEEQEIACDVDNYGRPLWSQQLAPVVLKLLAPAAHYEHVNVFWNGTYLDMFVDEMGLTNGLPINPRATEVYLNNVRVHQPELLIDATSIHGPAVLFDRKVWL
jgi:hypothetical protein